MNTLSEVRIGYTIHFGQLLYVSIHSLIGSDCFRQGVVIALSLHQTLSLPPNGQSAHWMKATMLFIIPLALNWSIM